jgi:hypothetical protein
MTPIGIGIAISSEFLDYSPAKIISAECAGLEDALIDDNNIFLVDDNGDCLTDD